MGIKELVYGNLAGHFYSLFSQFITANVDAVDGCPGSVSSVRVAPSTGSERKRAPVLVLPLLLFQTKVLSNEDK